MKNQVFGEILFNMGWKTKTTIELFGNSYEIIVKARAYFEKDGITAEQEASYSDFNEKKTEKLTIIEESLVELSDNAAKRFMPQMLLIQRNGEYALLLDDAEDLDDGIVVCLAPNVEIISQDMYL